MDMIFPLAGTRSRGNPPRPLFYSTVQPVIRSSTHGLVAVQMILECGEHRRFGFFFSLLSLAAAPTTVARSLECGDFRRFLFFAIAPTSAMCFPKRKIESGGDRRTPKNTLGVRPAPCDNTTVMQPSTTFQSSRALPWIKPAVIFSRRPPL
jgi:hypothetical protein